MNPQQIARIVQNEINKASKNINEKTYYRGIVTAVTGNKVNVRIEGNEYPLGNIICLDSYKPAVGDQVLVLSIGSSGANYIVLGKTDLNYTPAPPLVSDGWWREIGRATLKIDAYQLIVPITDPCTHMRIKINLKSVYNGVGSFWLGFNDDFIGSNYRRNQHVFESGTIATYKENTLPGIILGSCGELYGSLIADLEVSQSGSLSKTIVLLNVATDKQQRTGQAQWLSSNPITSLTLTSKDPAVRMEQIAEVIVLGHD